MNNEVLNIFVDKTEPVSLAGLVLVSLTYTVSVQVIFIFS